MTCIVKSCKSARRLLMGEMSFHRFPKSEDLLNSWSTALHLEPNKTKLWSRSALVCSRHFKESDFEADTGKNRKILKKQATPSLFLAESTADYENPVASTSRAPTFKTKSVKRPRTKPKKKLMCETDTSSTTDSPVKEMDKNVQARRKRRINEDMQTTTSSSSLSSGSKRRRVEFIKTIHSYSTSPSVIARKNKQMKARQNQLRKRLYDSKKKIKKLEREVKNIKSVIQFLKDKNDVSQNSLEHINQSVDSVPSLLMSRYLKNVKNQTTTHETYPAPLRQFAATLQFYSSRAYEEVRSTFQLALPSQATLRKWYTNIDCSPGYIDTAFEALREKSQMGTKVICSLMLDEMSIKKQIESDGKKTWGYVDIGVPMESDQLVPASNALVIMVVAQNSSWKLPIAYFLIKGLTGKEKANLVLESLIRLHKVGVRVTSVTCDGPSGHFAMFKELGCDISNGEDLKPYFLHPETSEKIFAIFDACHMLKLVRNNFCELKEFKNPDGNLIKWCYIEKLEEIQEHETLSLGNKLKPSHLQWKTQKMKVALAAQTLSRSVADSLKFLRIDLKHPDFQGSEATEDFIYLIDQLFDILNSKSPHAPGFKGPLRERNESIWRPFLMSAKLYLLNCSELQTGRPIYMTAKKTPFIGFAITIDGICGIFDEFVRTQILNYLLTFKCSQDHLETFFCSIRCRNGWNNNPTALQFMYAFRRLLLHTRVSGRGGNCRVLDSTVVLTIPSTSSKNEVTLDLSLMRKYNLEPHESVLEDHDYDCTRDFIPLTDYSSNVVAYISGFVIRMLQKRRVCVDCIYGGAMAETTEATGKDYMLIWRKNRGGLQIPSPGLIKICEKTELSIRKLMEITDNKIPNEEGFQKIFVLSMSQKFYEQVDDLFPHLKDHFMEGAPLEENHSFILVKAIVDCYSRIRFYNLQKKITAKIQGQAIRKKLTRLIIFSNQ